MTVRVSTQDFAMISEGGHYVDGSWVLSVRIDALKLDRKFRVQGDWSIGRVLVNLTEDLSYPPKPTLATSAISLSPDVGYSGWSDYALWWPAKRRWLLQTHASLDQYGIQADARLHFICTHGSLKVQLPDLQLREFCDVNFTEPVFKVVIRLCKHLGIRHPEELSLAQMDRNQGQGRLRHSTLSRSRDERWSTLPSQALSRSVFKLNTSSRTEVRPVRPLSTTLQSLEQAGNGPTTPPGGGDGSRPIGNKLQNCSRRPQVFGPPRVRNRNGLHFASSTSTRQRLTSGSRTDFSPSLYGGLAGAYKLEYIDDPSLVSSPPVSVKAALDSNHQLVRFRNFYQRARSSAVWLELGRSLMEQGLSPMPLVLDKDERGDVGRNLNEQEEDEEEDEENRVAKVPTVRLRFKYGLFYDLTAKNNAVRINQLFEQARWSIVTEAVECTNEEAAMFAALALQLHLASQRQQHSEVESGADGHASPVGSDLENGPRSATTLPLQHQLRTDSLPYLSDASLGNHRSFGNLQRSRISSLQDLESEIDSLLDDLTRNCIQDYNLSPTLRSVNGSRSAAVCRRENKYRYPAAAVGVRVGVDRRAMTEPRSNGQPSAVAGSDKKVTVADQTDGGVALPELSGYVKICKPRYLGIRVFKRVYVVLKKTILRVYKSLEDFKAHRPPIDQINLLGCESHPDISPTDDRYTLKLFVPMTRVALPLSTALTANDPEELDFAGRLKRRASLLSLTSLGGIGAVCGRVVSRVSGLLTEVILRLPDEGSYVDWSAAVRVAGSLSVMAPKTALTPEMVQRLYEAEKKATMDLLQLLSPYPAANRLTSAAMATGSDSVDASAKEAGSWLQSHLAEMLPLRITGEDAKSSAAQTSSSQESSASGGGGASTLLTHQSGKEESHARITKQILNVRSRLSEVRPTEIKLQYISRWQQLTGNGIIYFLARFETTLPLGAALGLPPQTDSDGVVRPYSYTAATTFGQIHHLALTSDPDSRQVTVSASRRPEVVGIGCGRVARYDQTTGEIHAAWRLDSVQGWHVNRELNELVLLLAPTPEDTAASGAARSASPASEPPRGGGHPVAQPPQRGGRVIIRPLEVNVQKVAEALGANVFLSLRSPTKSQELDEGRFYKLIGAPRSNALALSVV